ncbi:MAG: universal stress protein [Nitrospirota bacterium]
MNKILVAIEDSEGSLRAVDFTGEYFSRLPDVQVTLFHVLQNMPAEFWDDGHFLSDEERRKREEVVEKWIANRRAIIEPFFQKAVKLLVEKGMKSDRIMTKAVSITDDPADGILSEAADGSHHVLVLARHRYSKAKRVFMGSVTGRVVDRAAGITVCVVE